MSTSVEPDPEFARHLEWQLRTELRRRARGFAGEVDAVPDRRSRLLGWARIAALLTFAFLLGGAGVYAAERYQAQARAELEWARAELNLELAARRAEALAEELRRTELAYESGLIGEGERAEARGRSAQASHLRARRALDLEEVRASGLAPRDELSAPLVDGRDFARARLELERALGTELLELQRQQAERARALFEAGVVSTGEVDGAEVELRGLEVQLAKLELHLSLRASFLAGEVDARRVDLLAGEVAALAASEDLRRQLERAERERQRLEILWEQGVIGRAEVDALRLRAQELESELALAEIELEVLRSELER